jgi:uncharacterized protein YcbK (DUF882 family)
MRRLFLLAGLGAGCVALPLQGQSAVEERIAVGSSELDRTAPTSGLGWSRAIRVFVAGPGEPLAPSLLASLGQGWEQGHRWTLLHGSIEPFVIAEPAAAVLGDPGPRVLGDPVGGAVEPVPPVEAVSAVRPAAAVEPAAPEVAPTGAVDHDGRAAEPTPSVLGMPAPSGLGEPAPPAEDASPAVNGLAPAVLGEPAPVPGGSTAAAPTPLLSDAIVTPEETGVWVLESGTGSVVTVITHVPAARRRNGILNGYRIGTYPTEGSLRADAYAPPIAFIEVTPANRDMRISDHLTLGQFLTKDQFEVWPKYVALDLRLIDKLELVIDELGAMGIRAENIHVMSGFRTPLYNGPGGDGRAALSRHMWGDAADVWIDNDRDGDMDDLNGDGRVDLNDAAVVMRAVDRVERRYPELIGGAGTYPTAPTHPPYIHIDARGNHSRW